jgi:ADP-ribosylglycohydrolase
MDHLEQWAISGILAVVFIAANCVNLTLLLRLYRGGDEDDPSYPIVLIGGIGGAMSFAVSPSEALRAWYWTPLVADLGTVPYLTVLAAVLLHRVGKSRNWLQSVPFLHYRLEREAPARGPYPKEAAIVGCLLGTAVGDALGLACEGLSPRRQARMFPDLGGYKLLPFGKGLCSDDTEQTCMIAQSLIATAHFRDPDGMAQRMAVNFGWRLRFWLLGLPARVGFATLRAILKLWMGVPVRYAGVYSAGNAPAMRSALIGICYGADVPRMRALVRSATRVTHTDVKAQLGAQAVALAAHFAATAEDEVDPEEFVAELEPYCEGNERFVLLMRAMAASAARGESAAAYAESIGCAHGVTGFVYHTVPVALHVWLNRQRDYRGALIEAVRLGGHTDTVAAVVGALVGARVGREGIPGEWLRDLWEWPRTPAWMESLGRRLARSCHEEASAGEQPLNWFELWLRNVLFIPLLLAHGFRRLLPPY